jgi:uncharacterized protein
MKFALPIAAVAIVLGLLWAAPRRQTAAPKLTVTPSQLPADGYQTAVLTIEGAGAAPPSVTIVPARAASVEEISPTPHGFKATIRAGVTPATITLRVALPNAPAAAVTLTTALDPTDSAGDGTPDFLRLDNPDDRYAFSQWFTFLAETQFFQPAEKRPAEINDCAALIRYAYREALRAHDGPWATAEHLPVLPGIPNVAKYQYPYTPLGANLFRVQPNAFQAADLAAAFAQFADAKTLQLRNAHFITRDPARAQPGDLFFYRQENEHMPFHSMIYLGRSQFVRTPDRYLVYHTGPDAAGPGEIRRPTLEEMRRFPDADWRPLPANPRFLGVYRWNILRTAF